MRTMNGFSLVAAAVLLIAGCSEDPGTGTPMIDIGTMTSDSGPAGSDTGTDNNDGEPDAGSDDVGQTDPDVGSPGDMGGGGGDDIGMPTDDMGGNTMPDMSMTGGVYQSSGDPYAEGPLTVLASDLLSPVEAYGLAPAEPGTYPLVVFQHGFNLRNSYYNTLLGHIASHGFVVVAPQMYEPGFLGAPSTTDEATDAEALYDWAIANIATELGVDVATDRFALVGHSRGAKVLYLVLEGGYTGVTAAVGLDPVDGTGGPFGGEARVLEGGLAANVPNLFIGAELGTETVLGMACAPAGDNHEAFYNGAGSPSWWAFGEGYGHLDMLDDDTSGCGLTCTACVDGPDDGLFRQFSAGQITAFLRKQLQDDTTMDGYLTGVEPAPVTAQFMNK